MGYNHYKPRPVGQAQKKWYPKKSAHTPVSGPRTRLQRMWSAFQTAIFAEVANGSGHVVVDAKPGSGKTTTAVEALYHIPTGCSSIFLAFNKKIQLTLSDKVPEGIDCKTFHGLCFGVLRGKVGKVEVDNDKVYRAIVGLLGEEKETADVRECIRKCVDLCKGYLAETDNDINDIIDLHGLDVGDDKARSEFIVNVQKVLTLSFNQQKLIDFSDMIWLTYKLNLSMPKYDYIFVDETQDLNNAQVETLMRMCSPHTRIIAIGDPMQSIYGFRGAMCDAMAKLTTRLSAKVMPLSVSYRCAKSIVRVAQEIEPKIMWADDAPEGTVEHCGRERMMNDASAGDFIISRTNAPMVGICLQFIKEGRKANIQGRDMGKSLSYMIKKSGAADVGGFLTWLEKWEQVEVDRLVARNKEVSHIVDRCACMRVFSEGALTLDDIRANIAVVFDDRDNDLDRIILSTTHKAKGLERQRVWMLAPTFKPAKGGEEACIYYVAVTRAISTLMIVDEV